MHPRTREVRRPASGIDPRGSGTGQPPLLQGFLKHRKPGAPPKAGATEAAETDAAESAAAEPKPVAESIAAQPTPTPKPRKRAAPKT